MQWLPLALVLYVVLDAHAQGKLNLIAREFVPLRAQPLIDVPLHRLYPACYALLAGVVAFATANPWALLVALLLRMALFDVVLNLTKKDPLFATGTSAASDKVLNRLADIVGLNPGVLVAATKVLAAVGAVATILYF